MNHGEVNTADHRMASAPLVVGHAIPVQSSSVGGYPGGVESVSRPTAVLVPGVYRAIHAVLNDIGKVGIEKGRRNQQQGYQFRGIDDIYNFLNPLFSVHGLMILPRMMERTQEERVSAAGKPIFYVSVKAEFDFVAIEDGTLHTLCTYGEAMDAADKATNKAMSAAYKYVCMQAFAIPTEGDNDADAHTPPASTKVPPKPRATLSDEQFERLDRLAADVITEHGTGNKEGTLALVNGVTDVLEKRYLWYLFEKHPRIRELIRTQAQNIKKD